MQLLMFNGSSIQSSLEKKQTLITLSNAEAQTFCVCYGPNGSNVIKHFSSLIFFTLVISLSVCPFQPSRMFASKAGAYPSETYLKCYKLG
jgi:hypothetical protein